VRHIYTLLTPYFDSDVLSQDAFGTTPHHYIHGLQHPTSPSASRSSSRRVGQIIQGGWRTAVSCSTIRWTMLFASIQFDRVHDSEGWIYRRTYALFILHSKSRCLHNVRCLV